MTTSAAPPAAPLPPKPRVSTFAALQVKNYRFYLGSGFFQAGAMNMQMLANGWFAYHLTGSTAVLGLTLLAQAIPQTALSFVGGVVSDRIPRRLLLMMVFGINAALASWIAISAQLEIISGETSFSDRSSSDVAWRSSCRPAKASSASSLGAIAS